MATTLLSVGEKVEHKFIIDALAMSVSKKVYKTHTQYDVGEVLAAMDITLDFIAQDLDNKSLYLIFRP